MADEIVIVPFEVVVMVVLVEVLTAVDSAVLFLASSTFGVALSSFVMLAELFVRILEVALYESDVIAANGFGGGCSGICCVLIGLLKFCIAVNGDETLFPIDTIVMIGRFSFVVWA